MFAMQLNAPNQKLNLVRLPIPKPYDNEILIKVEACAVCRTDLHIIDGEIKNVSFPIILGHQVIGRVTKIGRGVKYITLNQRIGVPWLGNSCGKCKYCLLGQENLCDLAKYTGCTIQGGLAEYCVANADYCFNVPDKFNSIQAAPLMCAGLIGYRAFKKLPQSAEHIGIYGFGSAAHIITQVAKYLGKKIYAFTKENSKETQDFALKMGAVWAGSINENAPNLLDGAIIFAPIGELVPLALKATAKGGVVVCAGIHMSNIPSFPYEILWGERTICSVANLTMKDGIEFFALAREFPIYAKVNTYSLEQANQALEDLRYGRHEGTNVIVI